MNGITTAAALDLVTTTRNAVLGWGSFTSTFQRISYPITEIMVGKQVRADGGAEGVTRLVRTSASNNMEGTLMYGTQSYTQQDVLTSLLYKWVIAQTSWTISTDEIARNMGNRNALVNIQKGKREACFEGVANYFEDRLLRTKDSAADDKNPGGLMSFARMLGTGIDNPAGSYDGITQVYQDGSTDTQIGGKDAALLQNARLRNWAATFDGTITQQTIAQLYTAIRFTGFRPPRTIKLDASDATGDTKMPRPGFFIFMPTPLQDQLTQFVNAGPDDRKGNAMPFYGDIPLGPCQTVGVQAMNDLPNSPIIGINTAFTYLVSLAGQWLLEDVARIHPNMPRVILNPIFATYTPVCENPRANFCLHTRR